MLWSFDSVVVAVLVVIKLPLFYLRSEGIGSYRNKSRSSFQIMRPGEHTKELRESNVLYLTLKPLAHEVEDGLVQSVCHIHITPQVQLLQERAYSVGVTRNVVAAR